MDLIATLQCADQPGIVHAMTTAVLNCGGNIIGATAHFVTADLDEGPIIEQDVANVTHSSTPEELIALGRDIERRVLAKAVKLYAEDRIFIVGQRTIIFS